VSGLDAVVNFTSPAEVCLQPAVDAANQGSLNDLAAVSESQRKSIQQLVALWNVDVMSEGMQAVVCPCCTMPCCCNIANEFVEQAQVSGMLARLLLTSTLQMCHVLMGIASSWTCSNQLCRHSMLFIA